MIDKKASIVSNETTNIFIEPLSEMYLLGTTIDYSYYEFYMLFNISFANAWRDVDLNEFVFPYERTFGL